MEQGKVNAIIEGLKNSSLPDWTTARIRQLCTVIPLDQPIELSFFWNYEAARAGAVGDFCDFLVETGRELGTCDSSAVDPVMLYERPDSEFEDTIYTDSGAIYDEQYSFGSEHDIDTWGDAIDPSGFEVTTYPDITVVIVDELWTIANGDLPSLPSKMKERDWCIRHYQYADGYFEHEWGDETWSAFDAWCKKKGLENPYDGTEWG